MQFTTQVQIRNYDHKIDFTSRIVSLGSCFSVNIANKLAYNGLQIVSNPFGIFFHPLAIEKFIENVVERKTYDEANVFYLNERWHCFDAHSDISHSEKSTVLHSLNTAIEKTANEFSDATHIIITLGSAWFYRNLLSDKSVANCHKVPQIEFAKGLMSVDEIEVSLSKISSLLQSFNQNVKLIFTVSPVRHIKEGLEENQRSKANLIAALHNFINKNAQTTYFPSYEIMIDELRDYRFYTDDMLHPSPLAVTYIWEKFEQNFICKSTLADRLEILSVRKGLEHRSFNPESIAHLQFLADLQKRMSTLQRRFPHLIF